VSEATDSNHQPPERPSETGHPSQPGPAISAVQPQAVAISSELTRSWFPKLHKRLQPSASATELDQKLDALTDAAADLADDLTSQSKAA